MADFIDFKPTEITVRTDDLAWFMLVKPGTDIEVVGKRLRAVGADWNPASSPKGKIVFSEIGVAPYMIFQSDPSEADFIARRCERMIAEGA